MGNVGVAGVRHVTSTGDLPSAKAQGDLQVRVESAMNGSDQLRELTALRDDLPGILGPGDYGFALGHGGLAYGIRTQWFAEFESQWGKESLILWRTCYQGTPLAAKK